MPAVPTPAAVTQLARQRFCMQVGSGLPSVVEALKTRTSELLEQAYTAKEVQHARDIQMMLDKGGRMWVDGVRAALKQRVLQGTNTGKVVTHTVPGRLELLPTEAVEDQLLASKLALSVQDKLGQEWTDLKTRLLHADRLEELPSQEIMRPETVARLLVEEWGHAELGREQWQLMQGTLHKSLTEVLKAAYEDNNRFLVQQGVLPVIPSKSLMRKPMMGAGGVGIPAHGGGIPAQTAAEQAMVSGNGGFAGSQVGAYGTMYGAGAYPADPAAQGGYLGDHMGGYAMADPRLMAVPMATSGGQTQAMWGRAKGHAQDIMGRLMNVLVSRAGVNFAPPVPTHGPATGAGAGAGVVSGVGVGMPNTGAGGMIGHSGQPPMMLVPSPALQLLLQARLPPQAASAAAAGPLLSPAERMAQLERALAGEVATGAASGVGGVTGAGGAVVPVVDVAIPVEQALNDLKENSAELKKAAETPSEKATIEVVALMFQSILNEDRIRPSLRVWFARLQVPVLRLALAEPDFFSAQDHPARRLIDRMGSCALGFSPDASEVTGQALENEIRRIVQVIEQYPETGRRVFELSLKEFEKFLSKHLQAKGKANEVVTLAQQVEQKETLTVQFIIELRKQLDTMTIHDDVREFFFKVWAEVLAVGTVKYGLKSAETSDLKMVAVDLLWATSAKPNRAERTKIVAKLPDLLHRLRNGMTLLGLDTEIQDQHIKTLSAVLQQAFLAKTESMPPEQIAHITRNMSDLEAFASADGTGDLNLDQDSIEMIIGVDASNIVVIGAGGTPPSENMRMWANRLHLGSWYTLDHNNQMAQVQLTWRSQRGQLCLFCSSTQRYFLIHVVRVASYLQAGLLLPIEQEPLTMRATREALQKIDANPERLLA